MAKLKHFATSVACVIGMTLTACGGGGVVAAVAAVVLLAAGMAGLHRSRVQPQ